jgi:hypothetical protein
MRSGDVMAGWEKLGVALGTAAMLAGCGTDAPHQARGGSLSGQVVVSGPLRGATVSVDQLDYRAASSLAVRAHVGDTTTDDEGRFSVETGTYSGLLLVTARGGSFADLATGATLELDPSAGLESIEPLDLLEQRDDALVSPVGALIAARTRWKANQLGDVVIAERDAEAHLSRHFAGVPWLRIRLASLDTATTSPTEPVRAALVQAALSFLAQDIAQAAGASPQEVNVLTLTHQLAADLGQGPFDGNDGNSPASGEGLQVGACAPVTGCSAPPSTSCTLGACRPLCDLYAGTPRALLAGEVTRAIQSPAINHTGLATGDILTVARAMADNLDEDLFGKACIEDLDRLPPRIDWAAPTPSEAAYVHASFGIRAVASDDTDPRPQVVIDGYPNEPADSAASARVDASQVADGLLVLTAQAHDLAGNGTTIHRTVQVDNTPPALTLDPAGYFIDGNTWWTAAASPILTGAVTDAAPVTVATSTPAGTTPATRAGSSWSGGVAGMLDLAGADVTVSATDAAGNRAQLTRHLRADVTPPQLTLQPSPVNDEASELPTFDGNEAPVHVHTGNAVDLANAAGCPAVTKFSYLLGAAPPPYGREVTGQGVQHRNPLHYVLLGADDGVGIAAGSTQYRIGFQTAGATTWLLDWTPAPPPTPIAPGVDQYDIGIFSDQIPQLATTEGIYHIEFRATDRLARTATVARCFELHLRAPPLHFQTPGQGAPDPDPIPVDHAYRLRSLGLGPGAPFSAIAARLLNDHATGASLLDEDVTNGTASTVYLDVGVTRPSTVFGRQSFRLSHVGTTRTVSINCTRDPENPPPDLCGPPSAGPTYTSATSMDLSVPDPSFPARVFELDATLAPATEVPCLVCGVDNHWKFAIPPRAASASAMVPPRRFKVMTMIGRVALLWPSDGIFPASPPFRDTALGGISFTGLVSPASEGCVSHNLHMLPDGTTLDTCTRVATITPYRALTEVLLHIPSQVASMYATAPTPVAIPAQVVMSGSLPILWDPVQTTFP